MTHRRRNKKRHRNKSPPQTLSVAKKYRQNELVSESLVEQTDISENTDTEAESESESVAEPESVADQASSDPVNPESVLNPSSEIGEQINTSMAEGTAEIPEQEMSQMSQSIQNGGVPPYMNVDPGLMAPIGMPNTMNMGP